MVRNISVSTLVVVGREDLYTPVALAEQRVEGIRGATLSVIDEAGHIPNLERPAAFNDVLSSWLKSL
jgi:pimeloyl-ACP methyl ester carboxylesterase